MRRAQGLRSARGATVLSRLRARRCSTSCSPRPVPRRSTPSRRPRARSSRSTCCCPGCRGCATSAVDPRAAFAGTFHINERLQPAAGHVRRGRRRRGARPGPRARSTATRSPTASILGPELAAGDAQTLTLFGLHLPARLFRGDNEARREEALAATLRSLDSVLAEPIEDVLLRGAGRAPVPGGRAPRWTSSRTSACPAATSSTARCSGRGPRPRSRSARGASRPSTSGCWSCGAGARRGGGVSGIPGHNAAQAVLAGAPARPGARSVARVGQDRRHGSSAGVRPPHHRGAGHPLRPALVHRRARPAQVGGRRPGRARGGVRRGHRLRRQRHRGLRAGLRGRHARRARPLDVPGAALAR